MSRALDVLSTPCGSCPYRRDTPPGIWDASEYEKLGRFADGFDDGAGFPRVSVFLCHQTHAVGRDTVCRGWLAVEQGSLAVRVALCQGLVTPEQVSAPVRVPLYATGEEAAAAGLAGVATPPRAAKQVVARFLRQRRGRENDE